MPNVAHRQGQQAALTTAGTSLACNVPTNSNGDLLLMWVTTAVTTSAMAVTGGGWTKLLPSINHADMSATIWYRWASSEPASYTVTWTTNSEATIIMHSFSGVDPADPWISAYQTTPGDTIGSNNHTVPGVIANAGTFMTISFCSWNRSDVTPTQPSGYTLSQGPNTGGSDASSVKSASAFRSFANAADAANITWSAPAAVSTSICTIGLRSNNFETRRLAMRSFGRYADATSTANASPALPPLHRAGSLLLAFIGQFGLTNPTMSTEPTGWNIIGSIEHNGNASMAVYYKFDTGSETDPPVWSWSGTATNTFAQVQEIDYAGASPILASASADDNTSNTTYDTPSMTLVAQNPGYLQFHGVMLNGTAASNWASVTGYGTLGPSGNIARQSGCCAKMNTGANPSGAVFGGGTARTSVGWSVAIGTKKKLKAVATFIG